MHYNNIIRKFYMPEDPNDGNGPLNFPTATPLPPGAGYYDCGDGCKFYSYNPSCSICTPSPTPTPYPTSTPEPTPTSTPPLDCIDFDLPEQMGGAIQAFLVDRVLYYKVNLEQTQTNIYGEALEKWYYEGVMVRGSIERSPETIDNEMFGPDINQSIKITIPNAALSPSNILGLIIPADIKPEIGDILYDVSRERYYEVHNIAVVYYPILSNVGTLDCPQANILNFTLECYQTRISKLNLAPYKLL